MTAGLDDVVLATLCEARAYSAGHAPGAAWAGGASSADQATVIDSEPAPPPSPEVEMLLAEAALARLRRLGGPR